MKKIETFIDGLFILEPTVFNDSRGYFFEAFNASKYANIGIDASFVQDNESYSSKGVIRGLHYQLAPYAQSKLVRVVLGSVLDVAVDIRKNSPTYGKYFACELSAENKRLLYIPRGFAHGFSVLSDAAIVNYKCDSLYNSTAERGICFNDEELAIDWKVEKENAIVSPKDRVLPCFSSLETNFVYGRNY